MSRATGAVFFLPTFFATGFVVLAAFGELLAAFFGASSVAVIRRMFVFSDVVDGFLAMLSPKLKSLFSQTVKYHYSGAVQELQACPLVCYDKTQ